MPTIGRRVFIPLLVLVLLVGPARLMASDALSADANKQCPVMTDQPAKASKFVDYQGRRVYLCCDKCLQKFNANPAKYAANLPGGVPATTQPVVSAAAPPVRSTSSAAWQIFGKLHVATVHFPVALLVLAAVIELYPFRKKAQTPFDAAYLCLAAGAAAAVVAATMGWVLAANTFDGGDGRTLFLHRWLGTGLAAVSFVLLITATVARWRPSPRLFYSYKGGTLLAAVLVGVVGHLGGTLTHGEDYFTSVFATAAPTAPAQVAAAVPTTQPQATSDAPHAAAPTDATLQALLFGTDAEVRAARIKARLAYIPKPANPPQVDGPAFNEVDRFVLAKWRKANLPEATNPPPVCDDATFLRRAYLDVIGVIPTAAETKKFLDDTDADKRVKLIDALLTRTADYAAHWTPFFEDGIASTPAELIGGIPTHGNYQAWIFESFKDNKPYDLMVAELLDPTNPNYQRKDPVKVLGVSTQRGYVMNADHKATLATASNVGQFFLGTGMKCASCHSHFLNPDEWPQTRFLAFAGMFAPKDLELIRCEKSSGKFIPSSFPFQIPGAPTTLPTDVNQRLHLVTKLLTDPANPRFAKTLVNRLWRKYLGLGLFEPADDYREDSPAANPELLDWLAYDFVEHGYDVKHTVRLILTSRTYQLKYDPKLEDHFDVAKRNEPRYYRSPSLRRMTYEQLLDSMRLAASQKLDDQTRLYHNNESTSLTRALGKPGNRNEISTARADDVAIVQSLELLNGQEWYDLAYHNALVSDLAKEGEPTRVVARLYQTVLSRPPTGAESRVATEFLAASNLPKTDGAGGSRDVVLLDDTPPGGAKLAGTGKPAWRFVSAPDPVFSGTTSHTQSAARGAFTQHSLMHSHLIDLASDDDVLYAYVYLDPKDTPKEVMLQWNDGSWDHRAYWGENLIPSGADNTPARYHAGQIPKAGVWTRLEVPAKHVGLGTGSKIIGLSFDQHSGRAYWDKSGVQTHPLADDPAIGDLLWALFTSPEFQYIR